MESFLPSFSYIIFLSVVANFQLVRKNASYRIDRCLQFSPTDYKSIQECFSSGDNNSSEYNFPENCLQRNRNIESLFVRIVQKIKSEKIKGR